jgi:hypothetical protein
VKQQRSAAHVAPAREVSRKQQSLTENRKNLPSQLEGAFRIDQQGCTFSTSMRGRKKEYSFHETRIAAKPAHEANK